MHHPQKATSVRASWGNERYRAPIHQSDVFAHTCNESGRTLNLPAMPNLYDTLIAMLREHWKNHDNAYPQRIELSASDMQALHAERQLVNDSMNFKLLEGWKNSFHGTPLLLAEVSCMVDVNGQRIPVTLAAPVLVEK